MSSERDPQVGAAIRAIPVPDREPDFMTGLVARLDAAVAERDAEGLASAPGGDVAAVTAAARPLRRGRRRRLVVLAVAAAAVAAVLLAMLLGPGREAARHGGLPQPIAPLGGPEPATAQDVIRASLRATGAAESVRGVMTAGSLDHGRFVPGAGEDFLISSDGSYRLEAHRLRGTGSALPATFAWLTIPFGLKVVQDAPARSGSVVMNVPGQTDQAGLIRDLAAGQPYASQFFTTSLPLLTLRSYMRQLLDAKTLVLRQATIGGVDCWVIGTTMASSQSGVGEAAAERVQIAVDKRTLFPVRFTGSGRGVTAEVRISYGGTAGGAPAGAFGVSVPPGAHLVPIGPDFSVGPNGSSAGFRPIPFGDKAVMAQWIGYQPAFPTWMPSGFVRSGATYQATDDVGPVGGPLHPESDSAVVSLAYRRGFDAVYVGVQPNLSQSGSMTVNGRRYRGHFGDPFVQLYGPAWRYWRARTTDAVIRSGPFAGHVAHIVVDPSVLPHLWVRDPTSTATVSGDLSAADMVRVVEALATGEQVSAGEAVVR
jgi:hypothetical protein